MTSLLSIIDGERQKDQDIRTQNVTACVSLGNILKSSLGPIGLDKMIVDQIGDVTISNDGATILKKLEVEHPAAKVLVQLAERQDDEVGDGTTSVVLVAAELLRRANILVKNKIHPTTVISGYLMAMREATKYIRDNLRVIVEGLGDDVLLQVAQTSMSSKLIGPDKIFFSDLVVKAIKRVGMTTPDGRRTTYPVSAVHILKAPGKSAKESIFVEGFALNCTVAAQGMPKKIKGAKIACINFGLKKAALPHGVKIKKGPKDLLKIQEEEQDMVKRKIKKILDAGANVILTSKGLDDLSAKYLVQAKAMGVRRVTLRDLNRIADCTGARVVLEMIDDDEEGSTFNADCLGTADLVEQIHVGDNECILLSGTKHSLSSSLILRGANTYMLEEMERSVHDSLCAVKRVLESRSIVPGAGAVETALAMYLGGFAKTIGTREQLAISEFAKALLVIPKTLATNAGVDSTDLVAKLCTLHASALKSDDKKQFKMYGLDLKNQKAIDPVKAGIVEPGLSKVKSIRFATEAAITILRIDDMIKLNPKPAPKKHRH
mmetsp:Transcript_16296/g.18128  ORF Transcript_16296/g.18128 Transcript_16296/m.18128 type:complete len:547 (+) Transcript_16296:41-1681(+)